LPIDIFDKLKINREFWLKERDMLLVYLFGLLSERCIGNINRFYDRVVNKRSGVFDIDLSKIKDENVRGKAEKDIQSVKNVFTVENLIAGATILKATANEMNLKGRKIYFSRDGSWLWGYVAFMGMEQMEKK